VPSKVLTYLCAGRAIVGVLPPDNSVAEILLTHGAGIVVDPARRDDVVYEVARLLDDEACRGAMGRAGRRYAEQAFSPETAADRFVEVFGDLVDGPDGPPVTGRQTVRDQGMSSPGPRLIDHASSSTMGGATRSSNDDKVTASGPFPHHVG